MSDPTNRTKSEWLADLAESETEADAGLTVPLAPAMERARAAVRRLEAKAGLEPSRGADPGPTSLFISGFDFARANQ